MQSEQQNIDAKWKQIEIIYNRSSLSDRITAILFSRKLCIEKMYEFQIPGDTVAQKIGHLENYLEEWEKLRFAEKVVKQILEAPNFSISQEKTKEILNIYYHCTKYLEKDFTKELTVGEKVTLKIKFYGINKLFKIRKIVLFLVFLILFISFLGKTVTGRSFARLMVRISEIIVNWVIIGGLVLLGLFVIIGVSFYYFESRRNVKRKLTIENG